MTKRIFDFVGGVIALIVLSPVIVAAGVCCRIALGSPVVFRHQRPGKNGEVFTMFKFRTMTDARDQNGELLDDEKRLTPFGRFLRRSSIDELPELWNVVKGEMSLVGPRPLLIEYLPLYDAHQARRHDVLPGMTGWAQINGRNAATWEDKFKYDIWYVENRSLMLDIRILAGTVRRVFLGEGINQPGQATAERFIGAAGGKKPTP